MTVLYIGQDSTVVVCMTINCVKMLRDPAACIFCYRSCKEGRGETGGRVEEAEALGLVPWETCALM